MGEFCRETTNDSKEEVRNAWNDGRSRRDPNFAPRNKGKTMTRRAREKMQEQERPGLTKCDRMSQISITKDVSLAHPVYIMKEQPAQSIPSDNYVEKSLILTAYRYDRNFYCLAIDAMLNRIPLSQDLQIRVKCRPK